MNKESSESASTAKIVAIVASVLIVLGCYFFLTTPSAQKRKYSTTHDQNKIDIGGEFELINLDGKLENSAKYIGKYRLVYFGFTYCPDICPTALNLMSQIIDNLDKYGVEIVPIFVTIDPNRDSIAVLKPYLMHFNKKIIGYTGTDEQIRKVANQFKVYYAKVPRHDAPAEDYLLDHSSFLYFLDIHGNFIKHFPSSSSPNIVANEIMREIKGR